MAFDASTIYALDIETDTSGQPIDGVPAGLDPRNARITEIAVADASGGRVFEHRSEATMLGSADDYLRSLEPGLIVTWNGSHFDLPYLHDRAVRADVADPGLGLRLIPQPALRPKYGYLPGHAVGYGGVWERSARRPYLVHQMLDVSYAYRETAQRLGVKWSLKPVCEALGIPMIVVDRERMHELTPQERAAYAMSDVNGTRELAIRLLGAERSELAP